MEFENGDNVLCVVDKITGTTVFVKILSSGEPVADGSIIMSEIAPGRIRNLREYVVPKKKIVCKVIRISQSGNLDLSLRRVSQKEKKDVLEREKQEKSYKQIIKSVAGEKSEELIKKIIKEGELVDFFEEAKQNPKLLEKIISKNDAEKILEIINSQKQKSSIIKKEFSLSTKQSDGITLIKKILSEVPKETEIKYISAGKYMMKQESDNLKTADNKLKEILKEIENKSKKLGLEFSYKEK